MTGRSRLGAFYLRHEYAVVYVASSVVYVLVGMQWRFLLNWIVGPLWPIVSIWLVPIVVRRVLRWDEPLPGEGADERRVGDAAGDA